MRLDVSLFERGLARSRSEAKALIEDGLVTVSNFVVKKPSHDVSLDDEIKVTSDAHRYVSRGALKLESAIRHFDFEITDKLAIDVGASTGGFTERLLLGGARHVIAVDSGREQLAPSLKCDERVTSIEGYNARYMKSCDFPYLPDLAVMDVSFISATYIIGALYECLSDNADFICLIKPQFEVGKSNIGKGGIVKSEKVRLMAVDKVIEYAKSCGFEFVSYIKSDVQGTDGNIEYLAHFKKRKKQENLLYENSFDSQ